MCKLFLRLFRLIPKLVDEVSAPVTSPPPEPVTITPEPTPPPTPAPCSGIEDFEKVTRLVRRLALNLEQQGETLSRIEKQLAKLPEEPEIPPVTEGQWLALLEPLEKVHSTLDHEELSHRLLREVLEQIYKLSSLSPIAHLGSPPDPLLCDVIAVEEQRRYQEGMVSTVVRQGYIRADGRTIREARVIVAKEPPMVEEPEENEVMVSAEEARRAVGSRARWNYGSRIWNRFRNNK